ncbi:MAG: hypothetical protein SGBAC_012720, partial [Bacillariaceae sp.]
MDSAGLIVSLACAAYDTCQCAKKNKKDSLRIGDRLLNLVACTSDWSTKIGGNSKKEATLRCLEETLTRLNLVLQAHTLPQKQWTGKVKQFVKSRKIQDEITRCENELDSALQDFQLRQHTALYLQNQYMFQELRDQMNQQFLQIFSLLEQQKLPSANPRIKSTVSYQDKKDEILQGYQQDNKAKYNFGAAPEVSPLAYSSGSSISASIAEDQQSPKFRRNGAKGTEHSTVIQDELAQLVLDFTKLKCTYDLEAFLGEGSFSNVYKGTYREDEVAVKRFKLSKIDLLQMTASEKKQHTRRFQSEAVMMSRCGVHQHIVQFIACHIDLDSSQLPIIVMEHMRMTLFVAIHEERLPSIKQRVHLLRGVLGALEFLHIRRIVHQDVKTPNILLNEDLTVAKLSDFGEAKEKGFNTTQGTMNTTRTGGAASTVGAATASGTPCYQPPEVLVEDVTEASRKADIHAFGVVLWECLTGDIPHRKKRLLQILLLAQDESRNLLLDIPSVPNSRFKETEKKVWYILQSLTESCLQRDRTKRPTASKLVQKWRFDNLEDSGVHAYKKEQCELVRTLQSQLDSGDYGKISGEKKGLVLGPAVVLPPTAPSREQKEGYSRDSKASPNDYSYSTPTSNKLQLTPGVVAPAIEKDATTIEASSRAGVVRAGNVDGTNDTTDTEDIEVGCAEAAVVPPLSAADMVAVEPDKNKTTGNDGTEDAARAKKSRRVVIFVVTVLVIIAVAVSVLLVSKFASTDDDANALLTDPAYSDMSPTPNPTRSPTPIPTPLPTPIPLTRSTKVEAILADYFPFDEQAWIWLTDTDTWEPDDRDPYGDYL